jgi:hypothetical protein
MSTFVNSECILDEIGEYIGLSMWNNRDPNKTYSYPGARDDEDDYADHYFNGVISEFKGTYYLSYIREHIGYQSGQKSVYTINLKTMKPTIKSPNKKELTEELKNKLQNNLNLPTKIVGQKLNQSFS